MGAKRAVQGRTRLYDDLLLDWNRAFNPNFVEPVKRETKAEKKEKRDKEKAEKKRLATEAALAAGPDGIKKSTSATGGTSTKKTGKKAAAAAAATRLAEGEDAPENYDDVDSEAEVDALVHSVRTAQSNGIIGVPLAVPCDAGSWFVARRERLRNCKDLLANALTPMTNRNGLSGTMVPGLRLP